MWRVGLCESTGEELFWVRVDTSCVTPHFAFFFFFQGWGDQEIIVCRSDLAHWVFFV